MHHEPVKRIFGNKPKKILLAGWIAIDYVAFVTSWFVARSVFGDSFALLALLNTFALYLFVPLPILGLILIFVRQPRWLLVLLLPTFCFASLFGELFLPKFGQSPHLDTTLKLLTWNVNGGTPSAELVVNKLRQEAPTIAFLQEVNPHHAKGITTDLIEAYPYQWLEPMWDWRGMAIISQIPFHDHGWMQLGADPFAARWIDVEWQGQTIQFINVHLAVTYPGRDIAESFRERETQTSALAAFVDQHPNVIIVGDFNMTDTTGAYGILRHKMDEAFRQAGWGLGLTFPSEPDFVRRILAEQVVSNEQEVLPLAHSPLFQLLPAVPLARIDYMFYTKNIAAQQAYTSAWDGQSDHLAVAARVYFKP